MRYFIITGTSSGLGEALARKVISDHEKVFCISRRLNQSLKELADEMHEGLWYFEQDLTEVSGIPDLMNEVFSYIDKSLATEIVLINNAGVVEPVGPLGKFSIEDIKRHLEINLMVPIAMTNEFIRLSSGFQCLKTVINISSGAAYNPYFGWSLYCSSKAGLDMLTKTVGLEKEFNNIRILSVAPGVVDTGMQEKLRDVNETDFPMKQKFVRLHEDDKLVKPEIAAGNILKLLESNPETGSITDLRKIK